MEKMLNINGNLAIQQGERRIITIAANEKTEAVTLRVAAYCRVSTASDEQLNSYAAQNRYYTDLIAAHSNWKLVDVYADEGISGTSAEKRDDFQRLMADCRRGLIDRVLTKSISRFARNTKDCLEAIRELRSIGVSVAFEKENIDTSVMYNMGASLGDIAKELNARQMTQYNKTATWNKNMIDRILQDQRYSGDALYPEIISEELFSTVQRQRNIRSHAKRQTPAQRMIRILGGGRVSDTVEASVLAAINRLIRNPDALQSPVPPDPDQTKRFRTQRALNATLGQQPIDEDRAAELIKALAEAEYELIDNNEYETERLRRIFREAAPMEQLSADLLRKTVAEISVEIKAIKLTLKNKQIIEVSDVS